MTCKEAELNFSSGELGVPLCVSTHVNSTVGRILISSGSEGTGDTALITERKLLPVIGDKSHHIHLLQNATPHACHTPAIVLQHWENEMGDKLMDTIQDTKLLGNRFRKRRVMRLPV